tara:strand:+ start:175 stop:645 length:471 start_codon:yes stop_codon:yes gene_type:complete
MSGFTAAGISKTLVTTTQQAPLGFILTVPDGDKGAQEWIYVKAEDAFSIGEIAARKAATLTYENVKSAPTDCPSANVVGVAQHAIAAGSYGFILRKGIGKVIADTGGLTANSAMVVGNAVAGTADNVGAVTTHAFGVCLETKTATNAADCHVNCMG